MDGSRPRAATLHAPWPPNGRQKQRKKAKAKGKSEKRKRKRKRKREMKVGSEVGNHFCTPIQARAAGAPLFTYPHSLASALNPAAIGPEVAGCEAC